MLTSIALLWDRAAAQAAGEFAMTLDEITATIGPRDDPDITACVTMMFDGVVCRSGAFDAITVSTLAG